MEGDRMARRTKNHLRRFGGRRNSIVCRGRCGSGRYCHRLGSRHMRYLATPSLLTLMTPTVLAQGKSPQQTWKGINADINEMIHAQQRPPASSGKRSITISDAMSIFLQQNLQLVAARFDIQTADAEKLTARIRPNPQISADFE